MGLVDGTGERKGCFGGKVDKVEDGGVEAVDGGGQAGENAAEEGADESTPDDGDGKGGKNEVEEEPNEGESSKETEAEGKGGQPGGNANSEQEGKSTAKGKAQGESATDDVGDFGAEEADEAIGERGHPEENAAHDDKGEEGSDIGDESGVEGQKEERSEEKRAEGVRLAAETRAKAPDNGHESGAGGGGWSSDEEEVAHEGGDEECGAETGAEAGPAQKEVDEGGNDADVESGDREDVDDAGVGIALEVFAREGAVGTKGHGLDNVGFAGRDAECEVGGEGGAKAGETLTEGGARDVVQEGGGVGVGGDGEGFGAGSAVRSGGDEPGLAGFGKGAAFGSVVPIDHEGLGEDGRAVLEGGVAGGEARVRKAVWAGGDEAKVVADGEAKGKGVVGGAEGFDGGLEAGGMGVGLGGTPAQ